MPPALQHTLGRASASAPETTESPRLFRYADLWQHDTPLLDFLQQTYGERKLDTLGGSYGWSVRYRQVEDYEAIGLDTLGAYIDTFRAREIRLPYLRHLSVNRALRDTRSWLKLPDEFRPNWVDYPLLDRFSGPEFFIGQQGTAFGHLHQDQVNVHVGFVQLEGEKEFVLIPPEDGRYLYRMSGREFPWQLRNSGIPYAEIGNYEKFPLSRNARVQRVVLREGDALLLPADWWHTTRNLTDSVSFSIRIVNGSNAGRCLLSHLTGLARIPGRLLGKESRTNPGY